MSGNTPLNRWSVLISVACAVCIILVALVWFFAQQTVVPPSVVPQGEAAELRKLSEQWKKVIEEKGGEAAYAQFLAEAPTHTLALHSQAHAFGEALYAAEGISGLKACDPSFEFGCYHSFLGVAVHTEGVETLPLFAEACKDKYGSFNLPCEHGIGHGVLVYTDYDNLQRALELCETINPMPTGGCSSGVFMEYNFHTMDEQAGPYIRALGDNLYEPCDTLPERFQTSCYYEQVQWWQKLFDSDFKKIGELCSVLPKNSAVYEACYNGAGNYAASEANLDVERIVEICKDMPDDVTNGLCHEGATWVLQIYPEREEDARRLCRILSEPYKEQCLQKLAIPS